MPEHVDLLVWPVEREFRISKLLETVKNSVSKRAANHWRTIHPAAINASNGNCQFWQSGPGDNRNLDNDATIGASIDSIHRNPVRRARCARAVDWPWSSASLFAGNAGPFPIDRESLPADLRRGKIKGSTTLSKTPKSWRPEDLLTSRMNSRILSPKGRTRRSL